MAAPVPHLVLPSFSSSLRDPSPLSPFTRDKPGAALSTPGGSFTRSNRFFNPEIRDNTPGPIYRPKESDNHVSSPLYRRPLTGYSSMKASGVFSPSSTQDRSGWITGATKNDMAFYGDVAQDAGPAGLASMDSVLPQSPRMRFPREPRFKPANVVYMGKELDKHGNINTDSPGPCYFPRYSLNELKSPRQPAYSFSGDKVGSDRGTFLAAVVKGGHVYTGRPATAERHVLAGPSSYDIRTDYVLPQSPVVKFPKDERFKPLHVRYMGKKLDKHGNLSTVSPGPCYYPKNYELSNRILEKKRANINAKGLWCP